MNRLQSRTRRPLQRARRFGVLRPSSLADAQASVDQLREGRHVGAVRARIKAVPRPPLTTAGSPTPGQLEDAMPRMPLLQAPVGAWRYASPSLERLAKGCDVAKAEFDCNPRNGHRPVKQPCGRAFSAYTLSDLSEGTPLLTKATLERTHAYLECGSNASG